MIPEELRQYLLSKMAVLESYERQFLPEKRMAERVLAWLDAQPAAPEPDWRKAPKYANAWVASPFGTEAFFFNADTDVDSRAWEENDWGWILADIEAECESVKCNLPIGIDWRTTLRRRPEVKP